jgi:hypothetical protein
MLYATLNLETHGHGFEYICWRILGIHESKCGHSCMTDKKYKLMQLYDHLNIGNTILT